MTAPGFYAGVPQAWETIVPVLQATGQRWAREWAINDLRYLADRWRVAKGREEPLTVRELAERWRWSRGAVQRLRNDIDAWADPLHASDCAWMVGKCRAREPSWAVARRLEEDRSGTGAGQERDRSGTGAGQDETRKPAQSETGGTGAGQERDRSGTGAGQERDTTRARVSPNTEHRTPDHKQQQAADAAAKPDKPARHDFKRGWDEFVAIRQRYDPRAGELLYRVWGDRWRRHVERVGGVDRVLQAWRAWWLAPDLAWWRTHRQSYAAVSSFLTSPKWPEILSAGLGWDGRTVAPDARARLVALGIELDVEDEPEAAVLDDELAAVELPVPVEERDPRWAGLIRAAQRQAIAAAGVGQMGASERVRLDLSLGYLATAEVVECDDVVVVTLPAYMGATHEDVAAHVHPAVLEALAEIMGIPVVVRRAEAEAAR